MTISNNNSSNKNYGVIHEIGDYFKVQPLDEETNNTINEQMREYQKQKNLNNNKN